MPGSTSGELKLLSPSKPTETVKAAPQNVPLPSQPKIPETEPLGRPSAFEADPGRQQATRDPGEGPLSFSPPDPISPKKGLVP